MTKSVQDEIQAMVDRETRAWGSQDADTLVSLFHPDMVWPGQRFKRSRSTRLDMPDGCFHPDRWRSSWQTLLTPIFSFQPTEDSQDHRHRGRRWRLRCSRR